MQKPFEALKIFLNDALILNFNLKKGYEKFVTDVTIKM